MALTFKSKVENITLEDSLNSITVSYRYAVKDGKLSGNINGEARVDSRVVYYMSTSNGENFNSNSQQLAGDDLSGLNEKMKNDLVTIFNDPTSFLPV